MGSNMSEWLIVLIVLAALAAGAGLYVYAVRHKVRAVRNWHVRTAKRWRTWKLRRARAAGKVQEITLHVDKMRMEGKIRGGRL